MKINRIPIFILLSFLLFGCGSSPSKKVQIELIDRGAVKIGMGYHDVRRVLDLGMAWSWGYPLKYTTKELIRTYDNYDHDNPIYVFERKGIGMDFNFFTGNLNNHKLIKIFYKNSEYFDFLLNYTKLDDRDLNNLVRLKNWAIDREKRIANERKKAGVKDSDIKGKFAAGTAFFISNQGHLITNEHVIDTCKDNSQIKYRDKNIKAKLLATDKNLDLALLKADIKDNNYLSFSNTQPKKLKRIIVAGYPFGLELSDDLKFNSGIITSIKGLGNDSTRIQIDAAINKGNSGGPIVYEDTGEVIGVAVAGLRKDMSEAVNFGIKSTSVKNFLDANFFKSPILNKNNKSRNELAESLETSTVYTFCN
mgnify:CR=1 FL=1